MRMVSTIAMHALMFEISWPLPWEVSVPSFNKTICGSVVFFFQNAEWRREEKRFSDELCVCVVDIRTRRKAMREKRRR